MKKILLAILFNTIFFNVTFADKTNANNKTEIVLTHAEKKAQFKKLRGRLDEIHVIAKTVHLTATEKKELRNEVQNIKEQLQKMEGFYLYLSLTTILIILLLIILI